MNSQLALATILLLLLNAIFITTEILPENRCVQIEKAFTVADSERPLCQCALNPTSSASSAPIENSTTLDEEHVWIGCTRQNMPVLFRSLLSMNDTSISHLQIWGSLIPIIPSEMFAKIRPEKLSIETSRVGVIRTGGFSNIGRSLKELSLKNNILKDFEENTLTDLTQLTLLDLSGNKLTEIKPAQISTLKNLETLMLNGNQLSSLEDGLFQSFGNLRTLNLANNRLKRITRDTFKGLDKLEVLSLRDNRIESIAEGAFSHLKSLKLLDLWHNKINKVEVRGLHQLERLILANNSIASLADLTIGDLPSLTNLHLEENRVSMITDADLAGLAQSTKLVSLTMDGNNISWIGCRAFEPVPNLSVLSMQSNKIASLSCSSSRDPILSLVYLDHSVLEPLHSLRRLHLSYNDIAMVNDDDLGALASLQDLALDHNKLSKMGRNSFRGLNKLKKLFLNNNKLYYLPKGIFDELNTAQLQAVDISMNNWECICGQEWIGAWLSGLGPANAHSGSLGCLVAKKCEKPNPSDDPAYDDDDTSPEGHETWIIIAACILAFVAILFLLIAGYVYVQESRYTLPIRRFSSDTIRLIPSQESLYSFPNPIVLGANETPSKQQQPGKQAIFPPLPIRASTGAKGTGTTEEGDQAKREGSRKKVRFNE